MEPRKGLSLEGGAGMALALLSLLVPVDSPGWRISILFVGGLLLADAIRKSEWVKEKHPVFSVIDGFNPNESESRWRVLLAILLVAAGIVWYGIATWPPKSHPIELVSEHPPTISSPTKGTGGGNGIVFVSKEPTLRPKLPIKPNPISRPKGGEKPKPAPPKPIPAAYPIVMETGNNVTYDSSTGKITITISIGNTTQTEANAHLEVHTVGFVNGAAITGTLNSTERDLGLGPPPNIQQVTFEVNVSSDAKTNYESGVEYIMVYISVSYPDRNGTTTYHYQGKTTPKSTVLDEQSSHWDGPK